MAESRFLTVPHFPGPKIYQLAGLETAGLTGKETVRVGRGERMGADFFTGRSLKIVRGSRFADFLANTDGLFIISDRAQELLAREAEDEIEIMRFQLLDRKGIPRIERYAIGNPIRRIECLDPTRCKAELWTNPVSGEKKWIVSSVQVDVPKIPADARLFRLGEAPEVILIRSDLLQAIEDAGLTGLVAKELGQPLIDV